jgi:SPP1 gp7 family putative phage head morphogenesis protein
MAKLSSVEIEVERAILKIYKKKLDEVRSAILKFFEKYQKNGVLSYEEVVKWRRLQGLETAIKGTICEIGRNVYELDKEYFTKAYKCAYYRTAYNVEMSVKRDLNFEEPEEKKIREAINSIISGAVISERITRMVSNGVFNITSFVRRSFVNELPVSDITKQIKDTFGKKAVEAIRVVRTETHRALVEGRLGAMEHAAIEGVQIKKEWVASMDERTRKTHSELDGKTIDIDKEFDWIAADGSRVYAQGPGLRGNPGEDINCRCSVVEKIVGFEAKERSDARGCQIPYITREDWLKQHEFEY